jgi:hypothetical protein
VFGCIYEVGRSELKRLVQRMPVDPSIKHSQWASLSCNIVAAILATTASAPLNYIRNIKYASPASAPDPSYRRVMLGLWIEARRLPTTKERVQYTIQSLRIGWGSARVGVGMGIGQLAFDFCRDGLSAFQNPLPER